MEENSVEWRIVILIDPSRKFSPVKELWRGTDLSDPNIITATANAHRFLRYPKLQVHNGKDWFDFNSAEPDPRMGNETYYQAGLELLELIRPVLPTLLHHRT